MNNRDRAWEVVTEATNSDANCANDLSAIECQNCLALRIERALDAAAAAARADEREACAHVAEELFSDRHLERSFAGGRIAEQIRARGEVKP